MKSLVFTEWRHSNAASRKWTALVAAAAIGCFPASAFADNHGGHGGGGHPSGGGGHPGGGGHGGGAVHVAGGGGHAGGSGHSGGAPHVVSSGNRGGGGHGGSPHFNAGRQAVTSGAHSGGSHNIANTHGGRPSHQAAGNQNQAIASNGGKNFSRQSRSNAEHRAITQETRTNNRVLNKTVVHQNNARTRSLAEAQRIVHQNSGERLKNRALFVNRTSSFDRSITRTRARSLLNRRLNQISGRTWSGHRQFYANHFDPGNHCWYRHGSYWWRCNYWGAHSYCNRLIVLGFAPGLCWDWYDDICWGNIVVGMPLDLVDYYYPEPVYTTYTTYGDDGEEATVYYYASDDGHYKRVTVVDGDVVDVQIVDEIAYS
ncbi:MAG TPA: hypothetical protein VE641_00465 [Chthoniobacterales bacterium]|nr:hypothetical protein [Chthoniobacterales bacterium]